MVPYDRTVRRIVRTESTNNTTGSNIYVDEYGGRWMKLDYPLIDQTAPPMTGTIVGGAIVTGKSYSVR